MPDIPIDTLFIIGLIIASFVGKFFQKKTEDPSSTKRKSEKSSKTDKKTPNLGDVIKEAWDRANQPEVLQPEFTETIAPAFPIEADEPEYHAEKQLIKEEILPHTAALKSEEDFPTSTQKEQNEASHRWIKQNLFSGRNSLRQAFVLKEILDKPKSLRNFSS